MKLSTIKPGNRVQLKDGWPCVGTVIYLPPPHELACNAAPWMIPIRWDAPREGMRQTFDCVVFWNLVAAS